MRKTFLIIPFLLASYVLMGQSKSITLKPERKSDRSVAIHYEKTDPGTYTVIMDFTRLENAQQPPNHFVISGYSGTVTTLEPLDKRRGITYSYRSRYIRGLINPKINENFAYLLPYANNTEVMVREAVPRQSKSSAVETPDDWKAYRFYTNNQHPVTAMRKGTVVFVNSPQENLNLDETNKGDHLTIEHHDGTLGWYTGFESGSIPVKVGDIIYPGDTLGQNLPSRSGYSIGVIVYYIESDLTKKTQSKRRYVTPKFLTGSGVNHLQKNRLYSTKHTPEVLQKEMSRREIRNLKKK